MQECSRTAAVEQLTDIVALNRARTTLQRLGDAKFFNGWVRSITRRSITVRARVNGTIKAGEQFAFRVYGNVKEASFQGVLVEVRNEEVICPGEDRLRDLHEADLECQITSGLLLKDCGQLPRFHVEGIAADLLSVGENDPVSAAIVDVGPGGIGLISGKPIARGEILGVKVFGNGLSIAFVGEVRNVRECGSASSKHRVGLQIVEMDRINQARWRKFYTAIVEENRSNWAYDPNEAAKKKAA